MPHRNLLLSVLLLLVSRADAAPRSIWLEGESPNACNIQPTSGGWGRKEFLSGEKWLHLSIEADKVEKEVPAEGVRLRYDFTLSQAGKYGIWNRIGYEFVRSAFEWRVDSGAWQTIGPNVLTTDLMALQDWNEVAWLQMGERPLTAGKHTLEIRLPRTQDAQGKPQRILYASDALCLSAEPFHPRSKFKPDESGRDAQDAKAAQTLFTLPAPKATGERTAIPLKGLWEVCRHDEQQPGEVAKPLTELPQRPYWKAIPVPGDKNTLRPDLLLAHRLWYRTRIQVPASYAGRSFFLVFPQNNLNTTVFVNGVYCGFNKNPFARFEIDITKGVKTGVNEVWVGIRDAWYARSANPKDPMKLRKTFNIPVSFFGQGFQDLAYPIWNAPQSGLLVTPILVAAGPVRVSEVFCKPSVRKRELAVEMALANPTHRPLTGQLVCRALNATTGQVEKTFAPKPFTVPAGGKLPIQVAEKWENPKLWWPDAPQMYRLQTRLQVSGKTVDTSETPFGFREWGQQGTDFTLNGLVWHGWAALAETDNATDWLSWYRRTNQRMMRFWGTSWNGMAPDDALDWFDKNGVVVRRSGMLDGQAIGYMAIENDPALKALYQSEIKQELMQNWKDQMVAQVQGERNHPSVMIWSLENEWLYINCINLYGHLMDTFEAEVKKVSDAVLAADPTRLTMTDGGGAGKNNLLPVHGDHYVFGSVGGYTAYPALAYTPNPHGGGRGRWVWDQKRPRFMGEDYFANGINPFDYAYFGGEDTFVGKAQSRPTGGLIARMLTEGYRWAGISAFHFWLGESNAADYWLSNGPWAVFCREWDGTFGSGQKITRTFGLFNDTRFADPITFAWEIRLAGRPVAGVTTLHEIAPGKSARQPVTIPLPTVTTRTEGELILSLTVKNQEVYRDSKPISLLPPAFSAASFPLTKEDLLLYDPAGQVAYFLRLQGIPYTYLESLAQLPEKGRILVVGKDALTEAESGSSRLAAWAAAGRTVIVLEQTHPLRYQGLPADMETATNAGQIAWAEDLSHPALRNLQQKDFFTWRIYNETNPSESEIVYQNAYFKPTRGGKSLIQCDSRLQNTALVEVPAGKGQLLLSQLTLAEKLDSNAVARQLLSNLLTYGTNYKQEFRAVTAVLQDAPALKQALAAISLAYEVVQDPLTALAQPGKRIAILSATPATLHTLATHLPQVEAFTQAGGWIVLHGLTPEGLADYNRLVGFDHLIRPFTRERVTFAVPRNPLAAGLTNGDIVMRSGERIFAWTSDEYAASDIFTHCVDYDDVAPFATFQNAFHRNMVNGFVSADGWPYIVNLPNTENNFPMTLPKEQEIVEFTWVGNTFYDPATRVELTFDQDAAQKAVFAVKPNNEPQTFPLSPGRKGRQINLSIAAWKRGKDRELIGVDNISLKAKRPPEFYQRVKPLLNVGGLMAYPRGEGGLLLCNLWFKESEAVPENGAKKRRILATLLQNLNAPFTSGNRVIAGANLAYQPIDLSKFANQYKDERGWFGDKAFTFKDLPVGRQIFGNVPFEVAHFETSPVPTVLMLGGAGVPNNPAEAVRGIPLNRKVNALFFLQTARLDQRRNDPERREGKQYELFRYIVYYADGQTLPIPIYAETDIEDFRQKQPTALPGAQLAWVKPYPGTDLSAVAYTKQWDNPRPSVPIARIDMVYSEARRGIPVLLALTAALAP